MVDPRWQWTPTSFSSLGCAFTASRNHCSFSFLIPNLEFLFPVATYGWTYEKNIYIHNYLSAKLKIMTLKNSNLASSIIKYSHRIAANRGLNLQYPDI